MAVDALLTLQASTTRVASGSATGLTIPYGTARKGLFARIIYSAFSAATGTSTATFSIDHAADGTNYVTLASAQPLLASASATSGEIYIPFITPLAGNQSVTDAVRLTMTMTGAGVTTPTITYLGEIANGMP